MSRNDLPTPKAPNFDDRLRETVMTYLGKTGDPLDRGITLRDLVESGIVSLANLKLARTPGALPLTPGDAIGDQEVDLTPPPTPGGFTATGAVTSVIIEHDAPTYSQGGGHLRTRLYGAKYVSGPLPVFNDATEIHQFSGNISSFVTDPATTWHLWIKWETRAGVLSTSPAGGTNGVVVTTAQDVTTLLQALQGEITASQLQSALSTRIDLIDASDLVVGSVAYRVAAEAAARADAIAAEALARTTAITASSDNLQSQIDALAAASSGDLGELIAAVSAEQTARLEADNAFAAQVSTVVAANNGNVAAIKAEETTRATQDSAQVAFTTALVAKTGELTAGAINETTVRSNADSAQAGQLNALVVASGSNNAAVVLEQSARVTADSATASQITGLVSAVGQTAAGVVEERDTRASQDQALASTLNTVSASVGASYGAIRTVQNVSAAADSSFANQLQTLTVSTGTSNAALETLSRITAGPDGVTAQYTIKLDVNGYVSGFGLSSSSNGTPSSDFAIRADNFYIASPAGPGIAPAMPFIVRTTPTTINGVAVPAGVYMTDAFVQNGTITNAKIANAAIDNAKISSVSADKITAGTIAVGEFIQSASYSSGTAGWRIDGLGNSEFNNVTVRGTVVGSTITGGMINGSLIRTAESGQRIQMDSAGLLFLTGATSGKYGQFKYGAKKYGDGVLVYFNNVSKRVPFYVSGEQNVADIHLYNRGADPTGATYEAGDMICVNGRLKIFVPALGGWKTVALEP